MSDTRSRLIEAAAAAFYVGGYNVNMETIAAHAGVAKQTLYNHFASKSELFGEVIRRDARQMTTALGDDADLRTRLINFAVAFRTLVLGDRCVALERALLGEASRFPDMLRTFYESGPAHTVRELTQLFIEEMRLGHMRGQGETDARFAADLLLGMLNGADRTRRLFGMDNNLTAAPDDRQHAERIIDHLLRVYAP